jgi:hypothetical protein
MAKKYTSKFTGQEIDNILTEAQEHINIIEDKQPQKITYEELRALRDNGELIPDKKYQITDYEISFNNKYPQLSYAGHKFDIIVTAKSNNELLEDAKAAHHYNQPDLLETIILNGVDYTRFPEGDVSHFKNGDSTYLNYLFRD